MLERWSAKLLIGALALALVAAACSSDDAADTTTTTTTPTAGAATPASDAIDVTSPDFENGDPIPEKYSAAGENVNPALDWTGVPDSAESLVLIMDDPDAPGSSPFVHWVVFDIDPSSTDTGEDEVPSGGVQGTNSAGDRSYMGPAPPAGEEHRYFFKVFAVDEKLDLEPSATAEDVMNAIDGKTLGQGELMGTFETSG